MAKNDKKLAKKCFISPNQWSMGTMATSDGDSPIDEEMGQVVYKTDTIFQRQSSSKMLPGATIIRSHCYG